MDIQTSCMSITTPMNGRVLFNCSFCYLAKGHVATSYIYVLHQMYAGQIPSSNCPKSSDIQRITHISLYLILGGGQAPTEQFRHTSNRIRVEHPGVHSHPASISPSQHGGSKGGKIIVMYVCVCAYMHTCILVRGKPKEKLCI